DGAVGGDVEPGAGGECRLSFGFARERERIGRKRQRQGEAGRSPKKIAPAEILHVAMLCHGSALLRRALNCADDPQIGAAAAEVALHVLDNLCPRWLLVGGE